MKKIPIFQKGSCVAESNPQPILRIGLYRNIPKHEDGL